MKEYLLKNVLQNSTYAILLMLVTTSCSHTPLKRDIASELSCSQLLTNFFPQSKYIKEVIDEKLFAIHLTDYLPEDGIIKTSTDSRARFATTIHFSLGEPVQSHDLGNWDNKKYAIVLPFKSLKDQLVNILAQDTFIVGDLMLPKEAILIIPSGSTPPKGYLGKTIYYDNEKIGDAVNKLIKKENGIELHSTDSYSKEIFVNKEKIDPTVFFQDYFKSNKHLTSTLHASTLLGIIDVGIYEIIGSWFRQDYEQSFSLNFLIYSRKLFEKALKVADDQIKEMKLPKVAMQSYLKNRKIVNGPLNLLDAEIELQKKYKKSFLASDTFFLRDDLVKHRNDPDMIKQLLMDNLDQLPDVEAVGNPTTRDFMRDSKWLDFTEFKNFINQNKELFADDTDIYIRYVTTLRAFELLEENKLSFKAASEEFKRNIQFIKNGDEDHQYEYLIETLRIIKSQETRKMLLHDSQNYDLFKSKVPSKTWNEIIEEN